MAVVVVVFTRHHHVYEGASLTSAVKGLYEGAKCVRYGARYAVRKSMVSSRNDFIRSVVVM